MIPNGRRSREAGIWSQGWNDNERGVLKPQGRGSWRPLLLVGRFPPLAFSQKSEVAAVAIAVRLLFISIFSLGASVQEGPLTP